MRLREKEGDGLAGEGLDEDLHSTAKTKDQVECALLLDVIGEGAAVFELLAGEDKPLLVRGIPSCPHCYLSQKLNGGLIEVLILQIDKPQVVMT